MDIQELLEKADKKFIKVHSGYNIPVQWQQSVLQIC